METIVGLSLFEKFNVYRAEVSVHIDSILLAQNGQQKASLICVIIWL